MVYLFFRDISERKKSDAIIEKKGKYFRALVENNQGIITVIDEEFKVCLALHLLVSQGIPIKNLMQLQMKTIIQII
jgi:hypothetical protein